MITDKIYVNNSGVGRDDALKETERMCDYLNLSRKSRLHIRLLTEELLGMTAQIGGDFDAELWSEYEGQTCRICLEAELNKMSQEKREALIAVSTSGKNAAAKGFMGKLKDILETCWLGSPSSADYGVYMNSAAQEYFPTSITSSSGLVINLQLSDFRNEINDQEKLEDSEKWDELEKSIVANIADEISVGIKGNTVVLTITKNIDQ